MTEPDVFRGDEARVGEGAEEAGPEKVRKMLGWLTGAASPVSC